MSRYRGPTARPANRARGGTPSTWAAGTSSPPEPQAPRRRRRSPLRPNLPQRRNRSRCGVVKRGMRTHTVRCAGLAGILATTSVLALAGCGGHANSARTSNAAPRSGSPQASGQQTMFAQATGPAPAWSSDAGTITTTGLGRVSGTPDTMTVSIQVSTSGPHAAAALTRDNVLTLAVQHALQRDGVAAKDIQTTGLSLQQTFPPNAAGYEVDDEVSATMRHLALAGAAIDDAIAAAGDAGRLDGVTFSMSDTSPLMAAARQQAVAAARSDAAQLAAGAGESLVGLRSLTEQTNQDTVVPYRQATAAAGSATAAPVPVEPGTQQMSVVVTAVWDVRP